MVKVTPAADAREPGRWHRPQPRARGRNARRRAEPLIAQVPAVRWEGAHSDSAHTHVRYTHARNSNLMETHMRSHRHAYTHGHACTDMRTHTKENKHTKEHTLIARTCTRTSELRRGPSTSAAPRVPPRYPLVPPITPTVPPRYPLVPLGNPVRPPPYRVGTAIVPRACSAKYPLSSSLSSLETRKDRVVLSRARLKLNPLVSLQYPSCTL